LIRSPAPPMSFDLKRFAMRYPWVKPNKSGMKDGVKHRDLLSRQSRE
jgi:hypothetical protein